MSQNYYCIITDKGLEKEAASKLENSEPLSLVKIAVGDGGGAYYDPTSDATALVNECYRTKDEHPINVVVDDNHPNQVIIEGLIPEDTDGKSFYIREVGVFDSDGDLFAIGKYPETYKTHISEGSNKRLYVRMILAFVTKLNVEVRVSQDINLDPNFASNIRNELANRLKISENFADLADKETARSNLDVYVKGDIDGKLDERLKKLSNLSDLADKSAARSNLNIYSTAEIDNDLRLIYGDLDSKLEISSNLFDVDDKAAARSNLSVFSQGEIDGKLDRKLEKLSNLSDLGNKETARSNLDVYSKSEVNNSVNTKLNKSSNLSDLTNKATARTNLNVYNKTEVDGKVNSRLNSDDNLSDLTSFINARNSLDVYNKGEVDGRVNSKLNSASNLSDLIDKGAARNNLGFGSAALAGNASENAKGVAQIATQAEVNSGADDQKFITPKKFLDSFSESKSSAGYTMLPNGMIFQWGTGSGNDAGWKNVNLSVPFPNYFIYVNCVEMMNPRTGNSHINFNTDIDSLSTFRFESIAQVSRNMRWFAVGF
ncbi:MAG: hypothetical protein ACJAZX_000397 [Rickettsiales bacterium]|jgi:hypothetical protein